MILSRVTFQVALVVAGLVAFAPTGPLVAADVPAEAAPEEVIPTVPAAVAGIVVLAEEGAQLRVLRARLQANLDRAESDLANEAAKPEGAAADAQVTAWQAQHDALMKRVTSVRAAVKRFDQFTFPSFTGRVEAARHDVKLAWANGQPTAVDSKRVNDAAESLGAVISAVQKMQNPRAAAEAEKAPVSPTQP